MNGQKTWVEVSGQALRSNIGALRSLTSPNTPLVGVVKANAYGHGLRTVVPVMLEEGITVFGVDSVDEALQVRELAPDAEVIVLGYTTEDRHKDIVQHQLQQVVYDETTIRSLNAAATSLHLRASVHLKIETGTLRQGIWPEHIGFFTNVFAECAYVDVVGVSTHYANIEDTEDPTYAEYQSTQFANALAELRGAGVNPRHVHSACSAAVILYPKTHGTLVRPGIATYGLWPSRGVRNTARLLGRRIELEPVLSWKTYIAQIKDAPMGARVGYGCTETLRRYSKIAVIPVGYFDGYDRKLSSIGEVIIRGQLCRVIGRVCMDMFMVDVTEVPNASQNDEVVLIGRGGKNRMRADDIAERLHTIHYEVTTRINPLIPRMLV